MGKVPKVWGGKLKSLGQMEASAEAQRSSSGSENHRRPLCIDPVGYREIQL